MNIVILDYITLGDDLDFSPVYAIGNVEKYATSTEDEARERIKNADAVIVNKVKMNESVLKDAKNLKIICETATGYDNIDIEYCKSRGIKVANTPGYSTFCVAQVTVSIASYLMTRLGDYRNFVHNGEYSQSASANKLTPVYNEFYGKTWGIIGYGNIGKKVGEVARALGCSVIYNKRNPVDDFNCVSLDELLKRSDIISIHCPLSNETSGMIGEKEIDKMKSNAIVINVARGAIWDENAMVNAIIEGKIGGLGCDVYSVEPFRDTHPFAKILSYNNVCLTPHMAWGAYETRTRCFNTVVSNIKAFLNGENQNIIC
jgi:glycerate dehydrogenase